MQKLLRLHADRSNYNYATTVVVFNITDWEGTIMVVNVSLPLWLYGGVHDLRIILVCA